MRRILQVGPRGLLLIGVAAALAVLVLPGGATPAAAQPKQPHYECYNVPGLAPDPAVTVDLLTPFGLEEDVAVGPGHYLCPPAIKTLLPGGDPEGNLDAPHLRCYDIDEPAPEPELTAKLETQFGLDVDVVVGAARELCVPTLKTVVGEDPPAGPLPTETHYKCYEIDGLDPAMDVDLVTQFGLESDVEVGPAIRLCLPTIKTVQQPTPEPEGTLFGARLVCHSIVGGTPPDPPRTVSLETQFFSPVPEPNVVVGVAQMLCVPAFTVVGGIAELPALAEGSAQSATPADGSGWSAGAYAALAGGLAAAAIALGGGAWYARRRWIQ